MQEQTDAKWTQKKKKRLEKYIVRGIPLVLRVHDLIYHGIIGEEAKERRESGDIREAEVRP